MRRFTSRRVALNRLPGLALGLFLLSACASAPRSAAPVAVPRFIELQEEPSISTFHFPRGLYSLDSEDSAGYYYRQPRQIMKHSFAGFTPYDGGLFVSKGQRRNVRGFVIWAGGKTKIGNLSRAQYELRD